MSKYIFYDKIEFMDVNISKLKDEILYRMQDVSNNERKLKSERYLKQLFVCLGVDAPSRNKIFKEFKPKFKLLSKDEYKELIDLIWSIGFREMDYFAIDLMIWKKKWYHQNDIDMMRFFITSKSWWDSVDSIASNMVGHILKEDKDFQLHTAEDWLASGNMWLQRSIIIHQLKYKEAVDESLLYSSIDYVMPTKEFFLQKAAGWALREYAKINPRSVKEYLSISTLPALTVREASKYL